MEYLKEPGQGVLPKRRARTARQQQTPYHTECTSSRTEFTQGNTQQFRTVWNNSPFIASRAAGKDIKRQGHLHNTVYNPPTKVRPHLDASKRDSR